jgi:hypothetical protein
MKVLKATSIHVLNRLEKKIMGRSSYHNSSGGFFIGDMEYGVRCELKKIETPCYRPLFVALEREDGEYIVSESPFGEAISFTKESAINAPFYWVVELKEYERALGEVERLAKEVLE